MEHPSLQMGILVPGSLEASRCNKLQLTVDSAKPTRGGARGTEAGRLIGKAGQKLRQALRKSALDRLCTPRCGTERSSRKVPMPSEVGPGAERR